MAASRRGKADLEAADEADQADGLAPQAEGVLVAGGFLADGKAADQGVQPIGNAHQRADERLRQVAAGAHRQVVLLDGPGHPLVLAVVAGVDPAHDALQRRELTDHGGEQVGLGQLRRPPDHPPPVPGRCVRPGRRPGRRGGCSWPMVPSRFWKTIPLQFRAAVGQGPFAVLVEEEQAVLEPRAQHPLVAAGGQAQVVDAGVVDRHEPRQQAAVRVGHREVFPCSRIEVTRASSGSCRNSSSKRPQMPNGCSTRLVTVSSSLVQHRPGLGHAGVFAHCPPHRLDHARSRRGRVDDDETGGQAVPVGGEAVHGEGLRARKRWPRVVLPQTMFSMVSGMVPPAYTPSSHWIGRAKARLLSAQRMDLGNTSSRTSASSTSGSRAAVSLPCTSSMATRYSPLAVCTTCSCSGPSPRERANRWPPW